MIIPFLQGGLGNQMFQIAAAYGLSRDLNTNMCVNYELWRAVHHTQHHTPTNIHPYRYTLFNNIPETSEKYDILYHYDKFAYHDLNADIDQVIHGYFQSDKYFKDYSAEIKSLFSVPKFNINNRIALHVRRGDYMNNPHFHNLVPVEYYERAIEYIGRNNDIVIYTDSVDVVKSEFNHITSNIVSNSYELADFFNIMSSRHIVGANSSFAWWAAYLSRTECKIFPSKWFGPDGPQDYHDIYTDDMIVLDIE